MKRAVAFMDVLGFRRLVETTTAEALGPRFAKILELVLENLNRPVLPDRDLPRLVPDYSTGNRPFCLSYSFSDSIILISHDSSRSGCLALLLFVLRATQVLLASGFPARSASAFGDMFVDSARSVFLGTALTHAYDLQRNQDWVGGIVDDSLVQPIPELSNGRDPLLAALFPKYQVPMKEGPVREHYTTNWRWNMIAQSGTRALFAKPLTWDVKRKISNTLEYARWIRSAGLAYPITPDAVPVEVRPFFIGSGPPPPTFEHGDDL